MRPMPRTALLLAPLTLFAGLTLVAGAAPASAAPATPAVSTVTKSIVRSAVLSTANQDMWGSGTARPTDTRLTLFDESWDEHGTFGPGISKVCPDLLPCSYYGSAFVGSVSGEIGLSVALKGLDDGTLSVTYPVTVSFTAPADNSFDPGAPVDITTSLVVDASQAKIVAHFPTLEHIGLEGVLKAKASLGGDVCFIGCIGPISAPPVAIDSSGEILGADPSKLNTCFKGALGFSFFLDTYTNPRCGDDGYFFSPNVEVSSTLHADGTLTATGEDKYAVLPVNVTPGGGSDFFLGAVTVKWTVVKAVITAIESMKQDLTFTPRVDVNLSWGKSLPFQVRSGADNSPLTSGAGSSASFKVGDTLRLTTNALNNKVITVVPTLSMGSATMSNSTRNASTTDARIDALAFHAITYDAEGDVDSDDGFGPVYSEHFPVGTTEASIFDGSFALAGFNAPVLESFDLVPRPVIEVRKNVVPVNAPGLFNLSVDGARVATNVGDGGTSGRLVLEPGTHVLSETAGTGGNLGLFDLSTTCVQSDGGAVHTQSAGTSPGLGASTNLVLTGGEDLICTVKNRLPAAVECDAMVFDNVILGTPGNDKLLGTNKRDMIIGYGGDDVIDSGSGDDCVAGNAGSDRVDLGAGNDVADAGSGNDQVGAGAGNDLVYARDGDDEVAGGDGADTVSGGAGSDTLTGGSDGDVLDGGPGIDAAHGSSGVDVCLAEKKTECER